MRERERQLDAILHSICDAVVALDGDGKITTLNAAAAAITGWPIDEALGKSAAEVLRIEDAAEGTVLADPPLWARAFKGEEIRVIPRGGGDSIPVEGGCTPIREEDGTYSGYVCVFRDVSASKAAEDLIATTLADLEAANARIERKRALLDAIFQSIPCGVLALDRESRVRALNPFLQQMFGLSPGTSMGSPVGRILGCETETGEYCPTCPRGSDGQCIFRASVQSAFRGERSQWREAELKIVSQGESRSFRIAVSATCGRLGDEDLCFLIVEDRTEIDTLRWALRTEVSFSGMVGRDGKMHDLFDTIRQVADSAVPVLVQGESGTGKELVATAIHSRGPRAASRFVAMNCGALPDTLLESELFGNVKGAFTGAVKDRKGRFELADGGTLFLDEVAELSPAMQVKLLRVIQEGTFERLGSEKTVSVDVRIISATNKNLEEEVARGRFRRDLFYRLCVVPISIPPLRDRSGDIPLLVEHIISRMAKLRGREPYEISSDAMALLMEHTWPGNVRELENVLQFAVLKSRGHPVTPEHLPRSVIHAPPSRLLRPSKRNRLSAENVAQALRATRGNKLQAAKRLNVSRASLYRFLNDHAGDIDGVIPED